MRENITNATPITTDENTIRGMNKSHHQALSVVSHQVPSPSKAILIPTIMTTGIYSRMANSVPIARMVKTNGFMYLV